jgi:hypothetical protein
MAGILNLWLQEKGTRLQKSGIDTASIFFREEANLHDLHVQPVATESDLTLIRNLNVPAIFTFYLIGQTWPKYIAVSAIDEENISFVNAEQNTTVNVSRQEFLELWSGEAYIFWKNFMELKGIISPRSKGASVKKLKLLLQQLGYNHISLNEKYDPETIQVIKDIQTRYGLNVDGMVGTFTKIVLYNEEREFDMPSLVKVEITATESEN